MAIYMPGWFIRS